MAIEKVRTYFKQFDLESKILEFEVSSATVDLAAEAVGVEGKRIAKTLSFKVDEKAILIVAAGDARVDNKKFKALFHTKAKMLTPEEVDTMIGHSIGGVCPFGINDDVKVYLDESLRRFDTVFPACGSSNSAIELTCPQMGQYAQNFQAWVDVCKLPEV